MEEAPLLVDDRDAQLLGVALIGDSYRTQALPLDVPGIRVVDAGQQMHQGCLARTVFSAERMHFTGKQVEVDAGKGLDAWKSFADPDAPQQRGQRRMASPRSAESYAA